MSTGIIMFLMIGATLRGISPKLCDPILMEIARSNIMMFMMLGAYPRGTSSKICAMIITGGTMPMDPSLVRHIITWAAIIGVTMIAPMLAVMVAMTMVRSIRHPVMNMA